MDILFLSLSLFSIKNDMCPIGFLFPFPAFFSFIIHGMLHTSSRIQYDWKNIFNVKTLFRLLTFIIVTLVLSERCEGGRVVLKIL